MIVRHRPSLVQLFFIRRGAVVHYVLPELSLVALVSLAVLAAHHFHGDFFDGFVTAPFTLLGVGLSIFLSFRNNACYDRWWEARRQWGQMLVSLRSLARQVEILPPPTAMGQRRHCLAFAHLMLARLRNRPALAGATPWLEATTLNTLAASPNPPDTLLQIMEQDMLGWLRQNLLDTVSYQHLSRRLQELCEVQTACDRINQTPLPFAYTLLLHRSAHLFCLALPFGLVQSLGWATPLFTTLVAYTFFGLDALSDQLENPFGEEDNDLPLDALTRNLEIEIRYQQGDPTLPAPLVPKDYVLL